MWPQLAIIVLTVWSLVFAFSCWQLGLRDYELGALLANLFWGINNVLALLPMVGAALYCEDDPATVEASLARERSVRLADAAA